MSVSSIWWRSETVYVRDGQQSVYISLDAKGSEMIVDPESGQWQFCEWRTKDKHECRESNTSRTWGPYRERALRR